jgi:ABC-type multidrug transport system ATPase subunit
MIEISHVSKSFGPVRALSDVSLTLGPGERTAFVGANGSGKTTLMRSVMGLLAVSGQVRIDGFDVRTHPERALRDVAYMPQVSPPLDAPVRELVRAIAALRGHAPARTAELADVMGLDYDRIARTRLRDLSGGTKQKLLAAMALASQPRVLVCDEPTANLDEAARHAFFGLVAQRPADAVLILCSHRTEEVRQLVDRVVELSEGHLVRDERLVEVLGQRALCRVEVRVQPGDAHAAPLSALGFLPVVGDLWRRSCTPGEKLGLVSRLLESRHLLSDLRVMDEEAWAAPGLSQTEVKA